MSEDLQQADALIARAMGAWRPAPRLSLSQWADEYFHLSPESSAEPGPWRTLPYQRGIMDAMTDPDTWRVSVIKSARIGYTKMVDAAIGHFMHQAPCSMLLVQPTLTDAKGFSKEEIDPMIRDSPALSEIMFSESEEEGPRGSGNTMLHKHFPGGVLTMVGANSGAGFRRVSRRVVIFDEVDAYPPSAGADGDQIELGIKRTESFWDRKVFAGSTPLVSGTSRIEAMWEEGDGRRFCVPCPTCGHMAPLIFQEKPGGVGGHCMRWPEGEPAKAFFSCQANGCVIEHHQKRDMIERGEWRACREFRGHASFHIWSAYSYSPNATWKDIAEAFLKAGKDPQKLRTFVNTWLGETWKERGEAPEWERLYERRELYEVATVPAGARFLTAGVDVQQDRWVYEVVAWGANKESWSVESGVIPGNPASEDEWKKVDELLDRTYPGPAGEMSIQVLGCDSGYLTNTVYSWGRRHPRSRVLALKGVGRAGAIIGAPVKVDVTVKGKRLARGYQVWPVGTDMAKAELYGWLQLAKPKDGEPFPSGYCHFPQYGQDFFKQLTAEELLQVKNRRGFIRYEWQVLPGRENHWLDTRVYARAAASLAGLDRMRVPPKPPPAPAATPESAPPEGRKDPAPPQAEPPWSGGGFLGRKRGGFLGSRGKNWLR